MSNKDYFWSPEDVQKLTSIYQNHAASNPDTSLDVAAKALSHKSRGCIAAKACRLGITSPRSKRPARYLSTQPAVKSEKVEDLPNFSELEESISDLFKNT